MTRDSILDIVLRRLGQREDNVSLRRQAVDELQLIQDNFEHNGVVLSNGGVFWPNFLISEVSSTVTALDENRVSVPIDFLMEAESGALFILEDNGKRTALVKEFFDNLRSAYSETGKPKYYAFLGDYFYLFPTPDAEYSLRLIYYQQDKKLSSDIENGWLKKAPQLMLNTLGATLASEYLGNADLYSVFQNRAQTYAQSLYNAEVAREMANFDMVKGETRLP